MGPFVHHVNADHQLPIGFNLVYHSLYVLTICPNAFLNAVTGFASTRHRFKVRGKI